MAQMGYVGDISVATPTTATGGTASLNSSGWTIMRNPKPSALNSVPWYVWAAVAGAAWWLFMKKGR